jgi:hypothetical protein
LIYRNVGDSEAYCDISVADDKARCLTLVVVCPGIQRLFLGEKCGKFSVVGDRRQKRRHRAGIIDARFGYGNFDPAAHEHTACAVPRLNSIDEINALCIYYAFLATVSHGPAAQDNSVSGAAAVTCRLIAVPAET